MVCTYCIMNYDIPRLLLLPNLVKQVILHFLIGRGGSGGGNRGQAPVILSLDPPVAPPNRESALIIQ